MVDTVTVGCAVGPKNSLDGLTEADSPVIGGRLVDSVTVVLKAFDPDRVVIDWPEVPGDNVSEVGEVETTKSPGGRTRPLKT